MRGKLTKLVHEFNFMKWLTLSPISSITLRVGGSKEQSNSEKKLVDSGSATQNDGFKDKLM